MEILDNAAKERVARFIALGGDPTRYMVRADKLREVIKNVADVSDATKEKLISDLDKNLIQGADLADSLQLGMFLGSCFFEYEDKEGLFKIITDMKNLGKLPVVSIRGEAVN